MADHSFSLVQPVNGTAVWNLSQHYQHTENNDKSNYMQMKEGLYHLYQCFSTAGPRSGTGHWHQLYRALILYI
jgi:hypothetical protein